MSAQFSVVRKAKKTVRNRRKIMKASRKHHYSIAQNHWSPTAFPTTPSQSNGADPRGDRAVEGHRLYRPSAAA